MEVKQLEQHKELVEVDTEEVAVEEVESTIFFDLKIGRAHV